VAGGSTAGIPAVPQKSLALAWSGRLLQIVLAI
jgi:hypothetical protein